MRRNRFLQKRTIFSQNFIKCSGYSIRYCISKTSCGGYLIPTEKGGRSKTSEVIAAIALVVSIISALFAGLSYFSTEASKRAYINIFVSDASFYTQNLTTNDELNYSMTTKIEGVITNEGQRSCQVNSVNFLITLPISEGLRRQNNLPPDTQTIGFKKTYVSPFSNLLGWENRIFDVEEKKSFTLSYTIPIDSSYLSLGESIITECKIEASFDDGLGAQTK